MNMIRRRRLLQLAVTALPQPAFAQGYPAKPIVVKVAFPPGGPADASIRAAAVGMERKLGQPLVIENVPGANGSIAAMSVSKAKADGYTLLGTTGIDFLVAPLTIATGKYRPQSFALVGVSGVADFVLVSNPGHNFKNVDELISSAKKRSKELSCGHWGAGSAPHLVSADFQARAGIRLLEVPYKGAAPTLIDVASSQLDLTFVPLGALTVGMIQQGKVKAIGIASTKRNHRLPEVPCLAELPALKDFEHSLWTALLAAPNTSPAVLAKLTAAMNAWTSSPENLERINASAARRLEAMTDAEAAAFLKAEHTKYVQLAHALKLRAE